ncbi:MAG: transcriptional regulator NrdR, partial [Ruminococcus sp.]|nr:transcriptional regulator NrdR [Ruminococcus sp.]
RFTTYEVVEKPTLMVYKKDGSFEPFDRDKLIKGVRNAIKKRPVSVEQVNKMVEDIENTYANNMQTETTTSEIGDKVLHGLKSLDLVAYVRFASVYKDFNDLDSFISIIKELR